MENRVLDIHCPQCGAPTEYSIASRQYVCEYCGGAFDTGIAAREKQGFRRMQSWQWRRS